ncbi:histidine kinase [Nocardia sp. NPDC049190]|uniref:sensor histidine kinase n=1 Tax=Nocardia sp. NPDC049190 TaxID=3155650 RepID=UPI00340A90CE
MTDRSSVGSDQGVALVVAAIQLVGGTFANMGQSGVRSLDIVGYLLLLAGPVALIWRRAYPVPVFVVTLAVCLTYVLLGYGDVPIFVSLVTAFLTAASTGSRWWTYPLVPLCALTLIWPLPALLGRTATVWQVFALMACLAVLLLVAEVVRQRQAVFVARRQQAEATRRDEVAWRERRNGEERLALARELHDGLAHHLSVINVQSSVALELLDKKPEQAESALTAIKTASRDALADMHSLLHTIHSATVTTPDEPTRDSPVDERDRRRRTRHSPEPARNKSVASERDSTANNRPGRGGGVAEPTPAPRSPTPSIDDLDQLLRLPRATGLTVDAQVRGTPQSLPSVIDAAAARIIQESLTNVVLHAPGADATVTVRYTADSIDITVDNARPTGAPAPRSGTSGGNGIIGMRERAHALGGALTAGPRPSGGFRVAARLPAHAVEQKPTAPNSSLHHHAAGQPTASDQPAKQ